MPAHSLDDLRALILAEAGLVIGASETYAVESRLATLARDEGVLDVRGLVRKARGDRELVRRICETVCVHETRFFRDDRMFRALAGSVIPELLQRGRTTLNIWCAAVASGQEAYSVAMLLRDHFPGVRAKITATDLSRAMITRAQRAVYSDFEISRGLTTAQQARHFVPVTGGWQVKPELRAMVELSPLNLAGPWPSWSSFDVVLVRNVLVYLDVPVRTRVLERMRAALARDGVLVLGAAEVPPADRADLARQVIDDAVFYRPTPQETP